MTTFPGAGVPWRIDGPLPEPPPHSLIAQARIVDDVDTAESGDQVERWINGMEVYPYPADPANVWDACNHGTNVKAAGGAMLHPDFGALTVYLSETCSSFGIFGKGLTNDEAQQRFVLRASLALAAVEAAAVEREFMAGDVLGNNPHLADGTGTYPNTDTATSVLNAFALLEDELAKSGKLGMIHCGPVIATYARNLRIVHVDDTNPALLRTTTGHRVIPGLGYRGQVTPPGHAAPGANQAWMYATGPVEIRRSAIDLQPQDLSQALDRAHNTVTYHVEKYYGVTWDTEVHASVLADTSKTTP